MYPEMAVSSIAAASLSGLPAREIVRAFSFAEEPGDLPVIVNESLTCADHVHSRV
jgi:hypothetical protein